MTLDERNALAAALRDASDAAYREADALEAEGKAEVGRFVTGQANGMRKAASLVGSFVFDKGAA